jgi:4-hydroxy-tetrahydrodipicolinate synthase
MDLAQQIRGIFPPVITPFNEDESVDNAGFRVVIDRLISNGVHGIFVLGSTGEGYTLTKDEKTHVIDLALEIVGGRVHLMVGTGAITTRESIELTQYAEKVGADCISVLTPYFISPTQDELYYHYKAMLESVSIPILAYNNPARTCVNLLPKTAAHLAQEFSHFIGIKDSSGDLSQTTEYVQVCPPTFRTMIGRDSQIFAGLTNGAAGAVPATANVAPSLAVDIYERTIQGDYVGALGAQERLAPLRRAFTLGTFPLVIKEAMAMLGRPGGPCRRPIQPLSAEKKDELRKILIDLALL